MRELSVAEQRYKAVLAVNGGRKTVTEVAAEWRVSLQTTHTWLARCCSIVWSDDFFPPRPSCLMLNPYIHGGTVMTAVASRIGHINLVAIPSTDQDRSIEFFTKLGFEKRTDIPFGDKYRWVEVYPPNGTTGIALAPPRSGGPVGVETGIGLTTDDIDATHAHLLSLSVDVDAEVSRMGEPVPPMFWFRDPDGNSLLIVQVS